MGHQLTMTTTHIVFGTRASLKLAYASRQFCPNLFETSRRTYQSQSVLNSGDARDTQILHFERVSTSDYL